MREFLARGVPGRKLLLCVLLVANVLLVYSNHFRNDFHFDDLPAIPQNPAIREVSTVHRAFVDPTLFSSAPEQRTYRPVTTASLALDYWLAGGLNTVYFHVSTFVWFAVQLVLMFLLFQWLMDWADPHPSNVWAALAAALVFGFHPANAETVNYIIQRGDVFNALGCVASLWLFVRYPSQRKFCWYLAPVILAMLAKPPALIFPLIVLIYVWLFEQEEVPAGKRILSLLRAVAPSLVASAAVGWLLARMQPPAWKNGAVSPLLYRIIQPYVSMHYFKSFFLPTDLSVDAGWRYATPFSLTAVAGYLFVLALTGIALALARTRRGKPAAFGIFWFFAALLPTSLMPLGDIMNDHRMFFPFVGLSLTVVWCLRLTLFQQTARLTKNRQWVYGSVAALFVILMVAASATRERNRTWLTEYSLWRDATLKNPRDLRAWINHGSYAFNEADYETALSDWEVAAALDPDCASCEADLVRVSSKLHRPDLTERHLQKMLTMKPDKPDAYIVYAELLGTTGRFDESTRMLDQAARLYPNSTEVSQAHLKLLLKRDAADRIPLLRALDTDHDTSLSAGELIAAPRVLLSLDKDGDGTLSAEECGANFGDESRLTSAFLQKARKEFMQSNPLLNALDTNGDGVISASEIRDAERELLTLDRNGDGRLDTSEMVPRFIADASRRILTALDRNHNGRIDPDEWTGPAGDRYRRLLNSADLDGDGVISLEELTNEIFYEADRDGDGVVTTEELERAIRSGEFGRPAAAPSHAGRPQRADDQLQGNL